MSKLAHILEGWGKSLGWMEVTPDTQALSIERLSICSACPFATESNFLKLLRGEARELSTISCSKCGCPVNEKSLVTNEKCPEEKWVK
jgi:hypothetical protein